VPAQEPANDRGCIRQDTNTLRRRRRTNRRGASSSASAQAQSWFRDVLSALAVPDMTLKEP